MWRGCGHPSVGAGIGARRGTAGLGTEVVARVGFHGALQRRFATIRATPGREVIVGREVRDATDES